MIIKHNIPSYSITWLANTYDKTSSKGIINNYYIPESIEELVDLCSFFYNNDEEFRIIGHTSNIYVLPETNIKNVICVRKLDKWIETENEIICECGVSVKKISSNMISKGIEGFSELIDLPGTVGAAIYGNAGVGECLLSNNLVSVDILLEDGTIRSFTPDKLQFQIRSSALKEFLLIGVIVSATFFKKHGDLKQIQERADYVHNWRKDNQPGPSNNLGTTVIFNSRNYTIYGIYIRILSKIVYLFVSIFFKINIIDVTLFLMGVFYLKPYMFGLNRFMWIDENAHVYFDEYIRIIRRMYKNVKFEIEVW